MLQVESYEGLTLAKTISMKIRTLQLIGIFAVIMGAISFYNTISGAINSPSSLSLKTITDLVLAWIAFYGGYQTIKLRLIGQRLLLIFFSYQAIATTILILIIIFVVTTDYVQFEPYAPQWILLYSSIIIFCILALILLLRKDTADYLQPENNHRHFELIGKIFSLATPGLGMALTSNTWGGVFWFYIYLTIATGIFVSGRGSLWDFLAKILLWIFFARIDWDFVEDAAASQKSLSSTPPLVNPEESSGSEKQDQAITE